MKFRKPGLMIRISLGDNGILVSIGFGDRCAVLCSNDGLSA